MLAFCLSFFLSFISVLFCLSAFLPACLTVSLSVFRLLFRSPSFFLSLSLSCILPLFIFFLSLFRPLITCFVALVSLSLTQNPGLYLDNYLSDFSDSKIILSSLPSGMPLLSSSWNTPMAIKVPFLGPKSIIFFLECILRDWPYCVIFGLQQGDLNYLKGCWTNNHNSKATWMPFDHTCTLVVVPSGNNKAP